MGRGISSEVSSHAKPYIIPCIACSLLLALAFVDTQGDVDTLFMNADQDTGILVVDAKFGIRVADLFQRIADDSLPHQHSRW